MLFADDIVLVVDTKHDLNARLDQWRATLGEKGLRISRSKTEYLYNDFSGACDGEETQITIMGQVVPWTTKFKYLGSFVQKDEGAHRLQVGWNRKLGHQENTIAKYGGSRDEDAKVDTWAHKVRQIRNEVFRERLGVASITDKIKEGRLRWFGHVKRRQTTAPVRVVETINVEGRTSRDYFRKHQRRLPHETRFHNHAKRKNLILEEMEELDTTSSHEDHSAEVDHDDCNKTEHNPRLSREAL
ncbi:uncharacterized protein LOC118481045 [Helianthus annuus]|uniref:uncharacterized protein LOC118481045 n=1 Tax=Helianthus annuus TaxID=4232 RepID=UPI001653109F|nr:uncharacterized protein LOC118481045 [Helianthus annuus]